jgi:glycosyltransferase involved in cell wall biosynthesis
MCAFNGARFLDAQLHSFAAQTRLPDELIVCDDASSDDSCKIVRDFARQAEFPVRLVVNDRNLGTTRNFEQGVRFCRGPIIALADQDDVWYPHKLERIENIFESSPSVLAVFSDADLIDECSKPLRHKLWNALAFTRGEQRQFARGKELDVLIRHPVVTGATMAFRKEFFELATPLPPDESHDRWLAFLLAARGRMELIPQPLMQYRRHGGQQIGPGPLTTQDKLAIAQARTGDFYCEEIHRFRELHSRFQERQRDFGNVEHIQDQIERKISHLKHRAGLTPTKLARIPKVLHHAFNGNYWRYSGGLRSIAKDLLIRE